MTKFRYFSCVEGRAFNRPGTDQFIGATRTREGFVWDPERIVSVPVDEIARNLKTWRNALRRLDIIEHPPSGGGSA